MIEGPEDTAVWRSGEELRRHFERHGARLRVRTVEAYDASARNTIRLGARLTYTDVRSGDDRVGYFNPGRSRFTVLSWDEATILSHFRATVSYIRRLPNVDYS